MIHGTTTLPERPKKQTLESLTNELEYVETTIKNLRNRRRDIKKKMNRFTNLKYNTQ